MTEETDRQILEELRNLNRLIRKAHWANVVAMTVLAVFVIAFFATLPLRHRLYSHHQPTMPVADSWRQARTLLDQGETEKGKEMLERLLRKYPDYYYGHVLMGSVYQEAGDLRSAEKSYARAAELFPDEDNEKTLVAIRKAIQKKETANQASEAIGTPSAPQPQR
jgi:cytochrome c-type biogenesis protein CcmH/NrfG